MPCCLLPANRTEGGLDADMEILLGLDTQIGSSWFMGVLGLIGIQQRVPPFRLLLSPLPTHKFSQHMSLSSAANSMVGSTESEGSDIDVVDSALCCRRLVCIAAAIVCRQAGRPRRLCRQVYHLKGARHASFGCRKLAA